jgi:hypothetical protein
MSVESAVAAVSGFLGTLLGPPAAFSSGPALHSAPSAPLAALNRRAHRDKWLKLSANPRHPLQSMRDLYYRTCHAALGAAGTDPAVLRHFDSAYPCVAAHCPISHERRRRGPGTAGNAGTVRRRWRYVH